MVRDRTGYWLGGVLAVALLLRIVAAVAVQQYVAQTPGRLCLIAGDAEGYWELGKRLAAGQRYEIYQPPRRILRMPGFPALLAISITLFGEHVSAARFVLAMIGTLACAAVYWLGAETFNRQVGLTAAGLAAISPAFVACSVMLLSETAFALGLLLSLIGLVRVGRLTVANAPAWALVSSGLVAGLAASLACYVRPSWLLFPPLAVMWLAVCPVRSSATSTAVPRRSGMLAGIAILFGLGLGLLPWTVRNYFVTGGHIVPTTLWMGPSLYDGLNPTANGDSHMEFLEHDALYQTHSEYDVDRHYRNEAWTWSIKNPGRVLQLAGIKLLRYWNTWPNTPQFDDWLIKTSLLAYLLPMCGLVAWGVSVERKRRSALVGSWSWVLFLTAGPILYFSLLHTIFVSSLRYRLPAEYPLLVLAAVGLQDVVSRITRDGANSGG